MSETVPEQGTWITHPWVAAGQRKIRFRVCMSSLKSVADVRRKLGVLDRHCEVRGRPPESLLRSHITFPLILAETRTRVQARIDHPVGNEGHHSGQSGRRHP